MRKGQYIYYIDAKLLSKIFKEIMMDILGRIEFLKPYTFAK